MTVIGQMRKGNPLLCITCGLFAFAKRLSHQLDQLTYQGDDSGVSPQEYQKLNEAITAFEQARSEKQA
jgi:hypothetical protein